MIAQRFRALGWVGGIASAATGLYLISLQVAAERAKLEDVDRRIVAAQRDMRALQTELGTRSSMRQLERFNTETLALAAPRAKQYVQGDVQFASLALDQASAKPAATLGAALEAARPPTPIAVPAIVQRTKPSPPPIERAAFATKEIGRSTSHFQHAAYVPTVRFPRVAMVERALVEREDVAVVRTPVHGRKARP